VHGIRCQRTADGIVAHGFVRALSWAMLKIIVSAAQAALTDRAETYDM
jgi:D-hexose-6-phosphate mutarotase